MIDRKEDGTPDFTLIANRIRLFTFSCKSLDVFSCEFGNEFAPRVEAYLRECFEESE